MEVIPFEIESEYLFPPRLLGLFHHEEVMVCTELVAPETLAVLERHASIIDVSEGDDESGITNGLRIGESVLCASNIEELSHGKTARKRRAASAIT